MKKSHPCWMTFLHLCKHACILIILQYSLSCSIGQCSNCSCRIITDIMRKRRGTYNKYVFHIPHLQITINCGCILLHPHDHATCIKGRLRSEEHTYELQSRGDLEC